MKTIQPKKQQQLQQQNLPLVSVTVLFIIVYGLGMAIVMTPQILWIATSMVEIAVAQMLIQSIAQVVKYAYTHRSLINQHFQFEKLSTPVCCFSFNKYQTVKEFDSCELI